MKRLKAILLLIVGLIFLFSQINWAKNEKLTPPSLPVFSGAIDEQFFSGNEKQVIAFIDNIQKKVEEIESYLKSLKPTPDIINTIDQLQSVTWQLKRLKQGLKLPSSSPSIILPQLKSPPYYPDTYYQLLDTYRQIVIQLQVLSRQKDLLQKQLELLTGQLKEAFLNYSSFLNHPPFPKAYLSLAQWLNLELQYAYEKFNLNRLLKQIQILKNRQQSCIERLATIFKHLKVTQKDLQSALLLAQKAKEKGQTEIESFKKQIAAIQREIILTDIKLDSLPPSSSSYKRELYEFRKEKLKALKDLLKDKIILIKIKTHKQLFKAQWLQVFTKTGQIKKDKFLETWDETLANWQDLEASLKTSLSQLYLKENLITEKLTFLKQKLGHKKTGPIIEAELALQAVKNAINLTQQTIDGIKNAIITIDFTLNLFKSNIHIWDKTLWEAKRFLAKAFPKIKAILYYPWFTIGQTPINLAALIKFILTLIIGFLILKWLKRQATGLLQKVPESYLNSASSLVTVGYYLGIVIIGLIALSVIGIKLHQIAILLGTLGVGIGFGLQTIANNFVSGIILLFEKTIKVGDIVEINEGLRGKVKRISMRSTIIRTYDGRDIVIPNSEFISGRVTTWTYDDDWKRLEIPFGVAYGTDVEKVFQIALEVAKSVPFTKEDSYHQTSVIFCGLGDSSLDFKLRVWCRVFELERQGIGQKILEGRYYTILYKALNEAGIEIPFPQRDIHIRSLPENIKKEFTEE